MSEYIITDEQIAENRRLHGKKLLVMPVIVRCRDCVKLNIVGECPCGFWALENLNGFCAWGERREEC